jgi:HEPN domain-containing protein
MNVETVEEWIDKADVDYNTALVAYRQRRVVIFDSTCFHAQQCVEKYLRRIS